MSPHSRSPTHLGAPPAAGRLPPPPDRCSLATSPPHAPRTRNRRPLRTACRFCRCRDRQHSAKCLLPTAPDNRNTCHRGLQNPDRSNIAIHQRTLMPLCFSDDLLVVTHYPRLRYIVQTSHSHAKYTCGVCQRCYVFIVAHMRDSIAAPCTWCTPQSSINMRRAEPLWRPCRSIIYLSNQEATLVALTTPEKYMQLAVSQVAAQRGIYDPSSKCRPAAACRSVQRRFMWDTILRSTCGGVRKMVRRRRLINWLRGSV